MCRNEDRKIKAYNLEGIGLDIEATDEGCSCFGAGLDRLAPFWTWSSLCFLEPLGVSASSLERLVEVAGEAGGAVSLAFVRLRPSLFQAGTCCSVMIAVARNQSHERPKKEGTKNMRKSIWIRGRSGSAKGWLFRSELSTARVCPLVIESFTITTTSSLIAHPSSHRLCFVGLLHSEFLHD